MKKINLVLIALMPIFTGCSSQSSQETSSSISPEQIKINEDEAKITSDTQYLYKIGENETKFVRLSFDSDSVRDLEDDLSSKSNLKLIDYSSNEKDERSLKLSTKEEYIENCCLDWDVINVICTKKFDEEIKIDSITLGNENIKYTLPVNLRFDFDNDYAFNPHFPDFPISYETCQGIYGDSIDNSSMHRYGYYGDGDGEYGAVFLFNLAMYFNIGFKPGVGGDFIINYITPSTLLEKYIEGIYYGYGPYEGSSEPEELYSLTLEYSEFSDGLDVTKGVTDDKCFFALKFKFGNYRLDENNSDSGIIGSYVNLNTTLWGIEYSIPLDMVVKVRTVLG